VRNVVDLIKKIDHLQMNVADVEASKNYFIDKLGFKLHSVIPGEGVFVVSNDILIGFFDAADYAKVHGGQPAPLGITHIGFEVDDVEKEQDELASRGVEFRRRPTVNLGTGRMISGFRDPDGFMWQLSKQHQKGTVPIINEK
jgi:catechol 2,3-dioxygenase-like lactoylglutathione lyase family enzyme